MEAPGNTGRITEIKRFELHHFKSETFTVTDKFLKPAVKVCLSKFSPRFIKMEILSFVGFWRQQTTGIAHSAADHRNV
jgi:hypothetical protein